MKDLATNKILITQLFWEGDRDQAMKLTKLLVDLEPKHSDLADLLFVSRFDCKHDSVTESWASRKFNTYSYTSTRRGTGWPNGCNSIFFGALEWIYHKMAGGKIPHYKAILILGPDSAPLSKDWLPKLHQNWDKLKNVYMAGALVEGGGREHINGDCVLLSGDLKFLKWLAVKIGDVKLSAGWDWYLASAFKQWGWADIPSIKSYWRIPQFTQEDWTSSVNHGIDWVHGVKTDDLLLLSRKNLL